MKIPVMKNDRDFLIYEGIADTSQKLARICNPCLCLIDQYNFQYPFFTDIISSAIVHVMFCPKYQTCFYPLSLKRLV